MRLTLIVPVYNGSAHLPDCLAAIRAGSRQPDELIVIDDSSSDASAEIAAKYDATVLHTGDGPHGPARARNQAARAATGDVLLFVDSDVAVHRDTVTRTIERLQDPGLSGVFGSYDERPTVRTPVSFYKNLQHHWVHQHSHRVAHTFWAGCGAIRRAAFEDVGGYDETFPRPSIEDIELGLRLTSADYRIELDPEILCTHLKRWTLVSLLRADIWGRAIPWSRLIAQRGQLPCDLNLDLSGRLSGTMAWLALILFIVSLFWHPAMWPALLALIGVLALNRSFYRLLRHRGGLVLEGAGILLHLLYYLYSGVTFALIAGPGLLRRQFCR